MIALTLIFPLLVILYHFIHVLAGSRSGVLFLCEILMGLLYIVVLPCLFLLTRETDNSCCTESAFLSPQHSLTLHVLIFICILSYLYSSWRIEAAPPIIELVINCFLVMAIPLNIFIGLHHKAEFAAFYQILIHFPITLLYLIVIIKNQSLFLSITVQPEHCQMSGIEKAAWKILKLNIFKKMPLLVLLCFPVLGFLIAFLLLFGQKPDSAIRAITDTYKHGLSQLDNECIKVVCPGPGSHFLCSIAAQGHTRIVKPTRLGERGGKSIICNRQLLISNAFEELLQEKLPFIHKPIRKFYNQIGNLIHRYYGAFNHKWVSDSIYIIMKPLEWFFLIILYVFDKKPENRIASQYIDKSGIEKSIN